MSRLFTRNYLNGMSDGLIDTGILTPWRNDKVATEMFDKVANDLGLPEFLETNLPDEINVKCGQYLIELNKYAAEVGYAPGSSAIAQAKVASISDPLARAFASSAYYMDKAASEGSLTDVGGNTPESAAMDFALAALDQRNRTSLKYLLGMGQTDLPEGGVVGRQMSVAPDGSPIITNTLTGLDKQAAVDAYTNSCNFLQALVNKGHEPTVKTVLASVGLSTSAEGLEVMTELLNVKTAEELEEGLDATVGVQDETGTVPDPELVEAIEEALEEYNQQKVSAESLDQINNALGSDIAQQAAQNPAFHAKVWDFLKTHKQDLGIAGGALAVGGALGTGAGMYLNSRDKEASTAEVAKEVAEKTVTDRLKNIGKYVKDTVEKYPKTSRGIGATALAGTTAGGAYLLTRDKKEKKAAFEQYLKMAAEGSLTDVGDNTLESAAATSRMAEQDLANRKLHEYLNGVGDSQLPNVGQVGASMKHPNGPEQVNPETTAQKEAMYTHAIKVAVDKWASHLPENMPTTEKQAHLIALAGMPEDYQYAYIRDLHA